MSSEQHTSPAPSAVAAPAATELRIHLLEFTLAVTAPVLLGSLPGAALRGALFHSLRERLRLCMRPELVTCQPCELRQICPISGVLATVDDAAPRGHEVPRPLAVQPPLHRGVFAPGSELRFGLTLFGRGVDFLPYLVRAMREWARGGLGERPPGGRRGAASLERVEALHPLTGQRQTILDRASGLLARPTLPLTEAEVAAAAERLPDDRLSLELLTPLRLVMGGQLVQPLEFEPLVARLVDRVEALERHYGGGIPPGRDVPALRALAREVRVVEDRTRWLDLQSWSSRLKRPTPVGGYVGRITFAGDLRPFRRWLIWGQFTHVGKDATKGNGWYRVSAEY